MAHYKVGYFVGRLATKSINRLLTEILFKDLTLYVYDYDADYPRSTPSRSSRPSTTARSAAR